MREQVRPESHWPTRSAMMLRQDTRLSGGKRQLQHVHGYGVAVWEKLRRSRRLSVSGLRLANEVLKWQSEDLVGASRRWTCCELILAWQLLSSSHIASIHALHSLFRLDPSDYILLTSLPCVSFCLYDLFRVHGLEIRPLAPMTPYHVHSCVHGLEVRPLAPLTAYQGLSTTLCNTTFTFLFLSLLFVSCPLDYLLRKAWPHISGGTRLFRHKPVPEEKQKGI